MERRAFFFSMFLVAGAAAQGKELHAFTIEGELTAVALDPNDNSAMIGYSTGGICVFGTIFEKAIRFHPFGGHSKAVSAAVFLPDGGTLATASLDGTIKLWDVKTCRNYQKAMNDSNGKANTAKPTPKSVIQAHSGGATALTVRADGQLLSGGLDGAIKLWDAKTGKATLVISGAHSGAVKAVVVRHDSDEIVSVGGDKVVKVWETRKGSLLRKSEPFKTAIAAMAISADGKKIAMGSGTPKKAGVIKVLDTATLKEDYTLDGPDDVVTCVVFHPKTAHLASGSADKMIRVWDLDKREKVSSAENAEPLRALAVLPDGTRFAAISATRLRWWNGFGAKD